MAARSRGLENLSIAAVDQLGNRLLLDVYVRLLGYEREEKKVEKNPRIRLFVAKRLSDGTLKEWDFDGRQYAWIQNLYITASLNHGSYEKYKESDVHEMMRLDKRVRKTRILTGDSYLTPRNLVDLFWDTIANTRKEFVNVFVNSADSEALGPLDGFVAESIEGGAFLEVLDYYGNLGPQRSVCEAIASFFGETRGRPLTVYVHYTLQADDMELIIDAWLQSDGTFEEKAVSWCGDVNPGTWNALKYRNILGRRICGYLAHPSRSSSLLISDDEILVVKFDPWHVPVDFEWIDAVIEYWRAGYGFHIYREEVLFPFNFKGSDDCLKFVEKYGPAVHRAGRLQLAHPRSPVSLVVTRFESWFEICVVEVSSETRNTASL
uniref:FBA_2 domain-containing protein n=1 Tax=Steinernema glaseri TaxID=37863 RepID=A0A1I7Z3F2_9BILA